MQKESSSKNIFNKIYFINSVLLVILFLILFGLSLLNYAIEIYYHGHEIGINEPWYQDVYQHVVSGFLEIFLITIGVLIISFIWQLLIFNLARKCIYRLKKFKKVGFIFFVYLIQTTLLILWASFWIYYHQIDYLNIDLLRILKDIILNEIHIVTFVLVLFLFFQLRLRKVINVYF